MPSRIEGIAIYRLGVAYTLVCIHPETEWCTDFDEIASSAQEESQ